MNREEAKAEISKIENRLKENDQLNCGDSFFILCELKEAWEEIDDWRDGAKRVMSENCPKDEKHCTCVPTLKKLLSEMAEVIKNFVEANELEQDFSKAEEVLAKYEKEGK